MPRIATRELPEAASAPPITASDPPESGDGEALDSEFSEALELPPAKRGPGRPRTKPDAAELPAPRKFNLKTEEFFEYWKLLEDIDPNRLIVYVWRTWPIIDKRADNPDAITNIGKMEKCPDPEDWRHGMLHRFGSGGYKLMLKDEGLRKPKAIAKTYIGHGDLNDPDYPPYLESLDELVVNHPDNQSFIEGLKQKGLWPGEKDMAAGEAMSALTGTIDRLSTKLADKSKDPAPAPVAAQTPAEVAIETIHMADRAFQSGMNLSEKVTDSMVKAAEERARVAEEKIKTVESSASPTSSLGLLKEVVDIVKVLAPSTTAPPPAANESSMVRDFMAREATLQGKIVEILQGQITALQTKANVPVAEAVKEVPREDFFSNLDKLMQAKEKLQGLFGGGEEPQREEKVPIWLQVAQSALAGLPSVATSLLAMSYNMAVAKTGNGQPILPAPAPDSPPAIDPVSNANPNPTGETMPVYLAMLRQIERPLINHLNDNDKTGADFAAALMDFHGRIAYDSIREQGKDTLMALLNSYPPIANVIQQIPERTSQFLDDFLNADAILAAEDAEDEANGGKPPVVIDIPPVVQHQEGVRSKRKAAPSA